MRNEIIKWLQARFCWIGLHKWGEWVMLPYEDTAPYAHKRRVCERCLDDQVESDGE